MITRRINNWINSPLVQLFFAWIVGGKRWEQFKKERIFALPDLKCDNPDALQGGREDK